MKILIDIAHPAHIHYFRNFCQEMTKNGHQYLMTLRNKEIIKELADAYDLNYEIRSSPHSKSQSKLSYALESIWNIFKISRKFKPDLFFDMGTIFASPIAKIMGKPYIAFDDTEVSVKARRLHMPFTNYILTPSSFRIDLGQKHIRFDGFMELGYLHPNYYSPDDSILDLLNVKKNEKYALFRFVSWEAHHDVGQSGISFDTKMKLVTELEKEMKVFISAEGDLPPELLKNRLSIPANRIHDVINFSNLVVTEGATMATEAALLGVPAIYNNTIFCGCTEELSNFGLIHKSPDEKDLIQKAIEYARSDSAKQSALQLKKDLLNEKIDLTAFISWFILEFPNSAEIINKDPSYIKNQF